MNKTLLAVACFLLVILMLSWANPHVVFDSSRISSLERIGTSDTHSQAIQQDETNALDSVLDSDFESSGSEEAGSILVDPEPVIINNAGCTSDADCEPPKPICLIPQDEQSGICVECIDDSHCPEGVCNLYKCSECSDDSHCTNPAKPACDILSGTCVECTPDNTDRCGGLTPFCHARKNECVECIHNSHCPEDKVCDGLEGECVTCTESDVSKCPLNLLSCNDLHECVECWVHDDPQYDDEGNVIPDTSANCPRDKCLCDFVNGGICIEADHCLDDSDDDPDVSDETVRIRREPLVSTTSVSSSDANFFSNLGNFFRNFF